jgi:hypothetical protein
VSVAIRHRIVWRWSITVFAVAFALNFVWEMAQAPLYGPMGTAWDATRRCLSASLGDGALVLGILTFVRVLIGHASVERQYALAIVVGVVVAVGVEFWGLSQGRWSYLASMPQIPGTAVGIVPLLQMAALTPVTMWLAEQVISEGA